MIEITDTANCAVDELSGISGYRHPEVCVGDVLIDEDARWDDDKEDYVSELAKLDRAHYIFTQATRGATRRGYGYRLKDYIEKNNLGTIVVSEPAKNPNTSNHVTVFVWTLNREGIKAWAKKKGVNV